MFTRVIQTRQFKSLPFSNCFLKVLIVVDINWGCATLFFSLNLLKYFYRLTNWCCSFPKGDIPLKLFQHWRFIVCPKTRLVLQLVITPKMISFWSGHFSIFLVRKEQTNPKKKRFSVTLEASCKLPHGAAKWIYILKYLITSTVEKWWDGKW